MRRTASRFGLRSLLRGGLALAGSGLLFGCGLLARGTVQPPKMPRVGYLSAGPLEAPPFGTFRDTLRDIGYVDGQTIAIERRFARGLDERLPELATDLVGLPVDLIVTVGVQATLAAKSATTSVPILFLRVGDPVSLGLVASLSRSGGNITGLASLNSSGLSQKRLELLKEAFPAVSRVAVLWNPSNAAHGPALSELEGIARTLRVELRPLPIRELSDYDAAFEAALRDGVEAVMPLTGDFPLNNNASRPVEFAARHRLPAMYPWPEYIDAGGLMAYMPDEAAGYRRAANYVDRILRGQSQPIYLSSSRGSSCS